MDSTTNTVVATTAMLTPFWLPSLLTVSEAAATVTPILGAVWLFLQIVAKVSAWMKRNED